MSWVSEFKPNSVQTNCLPVWLMILRDSGTWKHFWIPNVISDLSIDWLSVAWPKCYRTSHRKFKLNYLWEMWDSVCCLWWGAATRMTPRMSFNKDQCICWCVREAFRKMRFGSDDVTEQSMIIHSFLCLLIPVHGHMGLGAIPACIGDTLPFHHRAVHDNIIFHWSL